MSEPSGQDLGVASRRQVVRVALASGMVECVMRLLAVVLGVTIARVLDPREVGLLGLASILVSVLSLISSCVELAGVTNRVRGSDARHALVAVGIRVGLTSVLVVLTLLVLPMIGSVLAGGEGDAEFIDLVRLLLWQLGFEVAATFPRVVLQRRLDLAWLPVAGLVQVVAHVSLSLALLWNGYGAAGVVVACVAGAALSTAVPWLRLARVSGSREHQDPVGSVFMQIVTTTGRVIAARCIGYLNGRVDNVILAGVLGPTAMSFYGMAWTASRHPIGLLSHALESVLTPTLAHMQADTQRIGRAVREALQHYYLLLVPVCAGLFVAGPVLVTTVLGEKWVPLVPCLRVMSCTMLLAPMLTGFHSLLIGTGRAHLIAVGAGAQLATLLVLMAPLSRRWGLVGAAFGDFAAMMVVTFALWVGVRRALPDVEWNVPRAGGLPVLAGIVAGGAGWLVGGQVPSGLMRLASEVSVIALTYSGIVWWCGGRNSIVGLVALLGVSARRPRSGMDVAGSRP